MRLGFRLVLALACALAFAPAQQAINYASVNGSVRDAESAAMAGAQVEVRSQATGAVKAARTDTRGQFRIGYLRPGHYRLTVSQTGFTSYAQTLELELGSALNLDIRLEVATQNASVTVTAAAPVIEAARTQVAGTMGQHEIRQLPIAGRDIMNLALLIPGVAPANTGSTQTFAETSAIPGQGLSVSGQRNFSNSFIVDGLSANDDAAGLNGTFFDQDVVSQFQVVTAGGQAEYGGAGGGFVNLITRSGTDHMHGDAYGYVQNQRLNAADFLTGAKLPSTQAQYGASLGGPLGRHSTYYFVNFERREQNQDGLIAIAPPTVAALNRTLASDGYLGPEVTTGLYPNPIHDTNVYARLDRAWSANDQFDVRYSLYHVLSRNSRGVGGLSAVSAGTGLDNDNQTLAMANVAVLSPRMVNETRGEITFSNLQAPVNDALGPAVNISGVAVFGRLSVSPTARRNWLYQIVDNVSLQVGSHSLKIGGNFLYNDLAITFPQAAEGSYSFASLADFEAGQYTNSGFTQSFGSPVVEQTNPNVGMYGQDQWTVSPSLTVTVGARYDLQFLQAIATDTNNLSPRMGFAWVPFAARKTVLRGSYGIYFDRIPLRALANALQSSGNGTSRSGATFVTASLSPGQIGAPVFPNKLTTVPAGVLVNFTTMDRHMQNGTYQQASVQLEQQLGRRATVTATYQRVAGSDLIISVNQNPPTCLASGSNNGCRANLLFGNNKQYSPLASSTYNGLTVAFVERPVDWGSFRASYTYARAYDDVGEFFFSAPMNNFDIHEDWGRSDDDQRHRFILAGTLQAPSGSSGTLAKLTRHSQLSAAFRVYSAPPFNVVTGGNTVQGTPARPLLGDGNYLERNAGDGFGFSSLDARFSRSFAVGERLHLMALVDAYNLLNRRNDLIPNVTYGPGLYPGHAVPSFGLATAVGTARTLELGLRMEF